MKKLGLDPLFLLGLAIRLALIASLAPRAATEWFAPFMEASTSVLTLDPWSEWIARGGTPVAFPYGYAMWLALLPLGLAARLTGLTQLHAYELTLLLADVGLLVTLDRLVPDRRRLLLLAYWLSPIVILASYGLGLNDLIPALLLMLSVLATRRVALTSAGAFCAAAISAKLSMVVALPFFCIYLYHNRALRQRLRDFAAGFAGCALVLGGVFLLSRDGPAMLLSNPEMGKIYRLEFDLAGGVSLYLVPLMYLVMLYLVWRVRRINFDLFQVTTGMAFLLIVLMTPASPGWLVWCVPFLSLYQAMSGRVSILLIAVFTAIYVLGTLLVTPLQFANGTEFRLGSVLHVSGQQGSHVASLLHTAMVAIGVILAMRIWREAISGNDFFRLSRKPFVIGIAGDSGSGKDTLATSIAGLFGVHSVVKLSGDDYHLWDRQKPMWQVMTHLNPMANDLEGFCNDLVSLVDGESILSRTYDHASGKRGRQVRVRSNDFIVASGLHALYFPILRECCSLRIFLDIDEHLRRHFKIRRDVHERGHALASVLSSFERREADTERFIRPQSRYADVIFSLQPIHPDMLDHLDDRRPLRLKLIVTTRHGFNELSLNRVLVGVCGLHVDIDVGHEGDEVRMSIEGETSAADVALAAGILCPAVTEFLDITPGWQDGVIGLMQLVTLTHIDQAMTKRFIQ